MIKILADSSSDCMLSELKEKNVDFIPITVSLGDNHYQDGINLERNEFFKSMIELQEFPKTSQPSPQMFLDIFKTAKKSGDDLIYIALSSGLSGTIQSAMIAKDMISYDNIYIVDSLSATYTIKILIDYACELRDKGASAGEITAKLEALKSRVKVVAALDTLEYLYKGGRLSRTSAAVGEVIKIKPVVSLSAEDGGINVLGKFIGKNKAISGVMSALDESRIDDGFPIYTIYSYGTENCEKLEVRLSENNYKFAERLQIGPTIGSHIGPGAFGVVFVIKE